MKRSILIFLCAILLLSCKKDNNTPDALRIFTRSPVNTGSTGSSYTLKGTIVKESSVEIAECGFIYTQNSTQNNNLPNYYNPTGTMRTNISLNQKTPPANFEAPALLVSGQYYYIAAYVKIHNSKTGQDEIITGPYVLLST
jgi:hypothetical protein